MAINLATKYESKLAVAYTKASITQGKVATDYNWDGVNSIHILSPVTQDLNDYVRSGTNRYGTPAELQDTDQNMIITLDKSFAITIDRGNNDDQMQAKKSGVVVKQEIGEKVTPFFDSYAIKTWTAAAGTTTPMAALTKDTVLDMFIAAHSHMYNHNIPMGGATYAYVPTTTYAYLLRNPEFISVEKLGADILTNGVVGKCMDFVVVETPDSYFTVGTQALFAHKNSVLAPSKLTELFIHNDAPGISGTLIEGRYRGDAFVKSVINQGVLAITRSA